METIIAEWKTRVFVSFFEQRDIIIKVQIRFYKTFTYRNIREFGVLNYSLIRVMILISPICRNIMQRLRLQG